MADPYETLGVKRADDEAAIRVAYRKLAKKFHPDLNPGNAAALERFKAINAANDILSDPEKRGKFDRGEIDADGRDAPPRQYYRGQNYRGQNYQGQPPGDGGPYREQDGESFEDIFAAFRNGGFGAGPGDAARRGADVQYAVTVGFLDAARGAIQRLGLPDGRTLEVKIPAGVRDGHILRLRGQGRAGRDGAPAGDAMIEVSVSPHPFFRREADDIVLRLPVTLREAVLGGPVEVPTISGTVRLTIPAGAANGARLRLKGRGIADGHQYVELEVVMPPPGDVALADFLRDWTPQQPQDVRAAMRAAPGGQPGAAPGGAA